MGGSPSLTDLAIDLRLWCILESDMPVSFNVVLWWSSSIRRFMMIKGSYGVTLLTTSFLRGTFEDPGGICCTNLSASSLTLLILVSIQWSVCFRPKSIIGGGSPEGRRRNCE